MQIAPTPVTISERLIVAVEGAKAETELREREARERRFSSASRLDKVVALFVLGFLALPVVWVILRAF